MDEESKNVHARHRPDTPNSITPAWARSSFPWPVVQLRTRPPGFARPLLFSQSLQCAGGKSAAIFSAATALSYTSLGQVPVPYLGMTLPATFLFTGLRGTTRRARLAHDITVRLTANSLLSYSILTAQQSLAPVTTRGRLRRQSHAPTRQFAKVEGRQRQAAMTTGASGRTSQAGRHRLG